MKTTILLNLCTIATTLVSGEAKATIRGSQYQQSKSTPAPALTPEPTPTRTPYPYPHLKVHETILQAFNSPNLLPTLVDLFGDDATLCDPYPSCIVGKDAIEAQLTKMSAAIFDSYLIGMPLGKETSPFSGHSGGFWAPSFEMSLKSDGKPDGSCLVGSAEYIQWNFKENTDKLASLNIYYDQAGRWRQASKCAGACKGSYSTDEVCSKSVSSIMIGDGAEEPLARQNLSTHYGSLLAINDIPSSPEWVDAWVDLFSDDAAQCDPYPDCVYGTDAIRERFSGFQKAVQASKQRFIGNGLMVSKNVGFQMLTFTSTERETGCTQNHLQFEVLELADDPKFLKRMDAYYSPSVHTFHKC